MLACVATSPELIAGQRLTVGEFLLRSRVFPSLWLDVAVFTANDGAKLLATLNAGLATPDHQHSVERLAAAKSA